MFRVTWGEAELDRLADVVVAADLPRRQRIVSAVKRANAMLAADPIGTGESREHDLLRIMFIDRLCVVYRVDVTHRVVFVGHFAVR